MLRFGEKKVPKEKFCGAEKPTKIQNHNVDNIVFSKLIETKTNSKYLIVYLDKAIKPLVLIMPKISGYAKTFKVKNGDKGKDNKLISFTIRNERLLERYKAIWTEIEDLKNFELNSLPVHEDRYIKTKIRT